MNPNTNQPLFDLKYGYDTFDRLVSRDETDYTYTDGGEGQTLVTSTETVEKRIYDGDHVVMDFLYNGSSFNVEHRYLYGPAVDQVLAQENAVDGSVLWMLTDNEGTVRNIVDNSGNLVQQIHYDAFGEVLQAIGTSTTPLTRYLYTGRDYDLTTNLQYNRERWYDPHTGRWLSEDPIGFSAGDSNLYRYAGNDPTKMTDPAGTQQFIIGHGPIIASNPPLSNLPDHDAPPKPVNNATPSNRNWFPGWLSGWWSTGVDAAAEAVRAPVPVGTAAGGLEAVGEIFQADNIENGLRRMRDMQPENSPTWKEKNRKLQNCQRMREQARQNSSSGSSCELSLIVRPHTVVFPHPRLVGGCNDRPKVGISSGWYSCRGFALEHCGIPLVAFGGFPKKTGIPNEAVQFPMHNSINALPNGRNRAERKWASSQSRPRT